MVCTFKTGSCIICANERSDFIISQVGHGNDKLHNKLVSKCSLELPEKCTPQTSKMLPQTVQKWHLRISLLAPCIWPVQLRVLILICKVRHWCIIEMKRQKATPNQIQIEVWSYKFESNVNRNQLDNWKLLEWAINIGHIWSKHSQTILLPVSMDGLKVLLQWSAYKIWSLLAISHHSCLQVLRPMIFTFG